MGLLINGQWHDQWYDTKTSGGKFVRAGAQFRNWIDSDNYGFELPADAKRFPAESGRYHLYVSLACPWAHRTLIFRKLKGLEDHISVSVVSPDMLDNGWTFDQSAGASGDALYQSEFMHQIYSRAKPDYTGRVTVPVLWDKQQQTIVNNESSEIIRMLNCAFNELTGNTLDLYPAELRDEIERWNNYIYPNINNGVYRAGFATEQDAYEEALQSLFSALDTLEAHLAGQRYLAGDRITEADWRLFTTLIRFDAVYVGHFKCNLRRIADYPNLSGYLRELYQQPGVAETFNLEHIKRHYYYSHDTINPTRIVPVGPELDFDSPHGRERINAA
ncbi:glutathione S-transferase family protein [Marinobacterium arenosum]|uniref:glutathione S-transferase family protein n=1 Tax=Marinobacterium arenosum TaxID=2862496 RepID=UPI001C97349B|nr:glutathione S-transferase family protein [Marinobacterium arenosum]MBY4675403.1 glutathione S-transferase family protein [Marinobacterium arenosum]